MGVFMHDSEFEFLTVKELAKKLKVHESWVYGETRKTGPGAIPRTKVGKYLRFFLPKVLTWLEEQGNGAR